jgi:hypothetical protein
MPALREASVEGSSGSKRTAVKAHGGLARHLEGWQPGLLAVFVAGISALLAVPRPVLPDEIPEPLLDPRALAGAAQADRALAEAAEHERLDTDVRLLGSTLRAYGLADADGSTGAVVATRRDVAMAAKRAAAQGDGALARLRAYELRSFLRELRRWEATGEETSELRELGGPFVEHAEKSGWVQGFTAGALPRSSVSMGPRAAPNPGPASRGPLRLLPDETVRAALFKKRWVELTLVRGPAFELAPAETRALYRFLLIHPPRDPGEVETRAAEERSGYLAEQYRLKKIEELRVLDPSYPADLGRGVVLSRMRRYPQAADAFRRYLDEHAGGPYRLRAQNYLHATLEAL